MLNGRCKGKVGTTNETTDDPGSLREEWLSRLSELVQSVQQWAEERDWATRRIDKRMKDPILGRYEAPALLMQKETTRVLLDPVSRFATGADGLVDLYLMPAYDDIASIYFIKGQWRLRCTYPAGGVASRDEVDTTALCAESLGRVLDGMIVHAESSL